MKPLWAVLLSSCLIYHEAAGQAVSVRCDIDDYYNTTCTFNSLQLTRSNYRFTPLADDYDVREVRIIPPSRVPTVGPDICASFRNLKVFRLEPNIGAEELARNAFEGCQYVSELQMTEQRSIEEVTREMLAPMRWLQYINWTHSDIQELPQDVFSDLPEMWWLTWRQGKLRSFPASLVSAFQKMNILDVESNELTDLDVEGILAQTPNLEYVWFDDNPIKCSRVQQIKQALRARQMFPQPARAPKQGRSVQLIKDAEGFLCLRD